MFTDYWFRSNAPRTKGCVLEEGQPLAKIVKPEDKPTDPESVNVPEEWPEGLVITNKPALFYRGIIQTLSPHAFSTGARCPCPRCPRPERIAYRVSCADLSCDRTADDAASPLLGLWGPRNLADHHLHRRCRCQEPVRCPPRRPPQRPSPPVLSCDARTCANVQRVGGTRQ